MILAEIEWQGGNFAPIDEMLRALFKSGTNVRTLILNEQGARQITKRAARIDLAAVGGARVTFNMSDDTTLSPFLYLAAFCPVVQVFIAAAAGNGQILFSDVPAREGMRLSAFR